MRFIHVLLAVVSAVGLSGCGGLGQSIGETPNGSAAVQREHLRTFLYAHSTAKVRYWPRWDDVPGDYQYLKPGLRTLPTGYADVEVGLFSVTYETNNLPQLTLHLKRPGNLKLLVYNHGHAGWVADADTWAIEFLKSALLGGYDILMTSMPLVGLNSARSEPGAQYVMIPRGAARPYVIADPLLRQNSANNPHPLYEVLGDLDHFMHYFIDGAVIPASLIAGHLGRAERLPYLPQPPVLAPPRYTEINYVGLSGGATVGLVACAVHRFDRCVLISGFLPEHLRVIDHKNFGDVEQITRSFYGRFDVRTLMGLARASSGKLVMVYNRHDPCCFADPAASIFQRTFPGYDIRVTDLKLHGFVASDVMSMLRE